MPRNEQLKDRIQTYSPTFWTLLNNKAQKNLPGALIQYISKGSSSKIEATLKTIEKCLKELGRLCGLKAIGDNYRKDLSGVNSENRLAELFFEIAICTALGKISGRLQLHPPTDKGTYSDCLFHIQGFDMYAEVKRYVDPWPLIKKPGYESNKKVPYSRSIVKSSPSEKPQNSARPRYMDIRSKLHDVHKQFPERTLNILFVSDNPLNKTKRSLTQALFGESNFFKNAGEFVLKADGLFYLEEWHNISACCLARINANLDVIFRFAWRNPYALSEIPKAVLDTLCLNA